eukprot:751165-Hanusia_phi.AAC.1
MCRPTALRSSSSMCIQLPSSPSPQPGPAARVVAVEGPAAGPAHRAGQIGLPGAAGCDSVRSSEAAAWPGSWPAGSERVR